MHKFTCELCAGFCELTINCADLEEQLPWRCPSSNMEARWVEKVPEAINHGRECEKAVDSRMSMGMCEDPE